MLLDLALCLFGVGLLFLVFTLIAVFVNHGNIRNSLLASSPILFLAAAVAKYLAS
jgi:hypothetical protein